MRQILMFLMAMLLTCCSSESDVKVQTSSDMTQKLYLTIGGVTKTATMVTVPGDLILYQGSNLCIYYDTNSWNFTRIGKLDNMTQADIKTWVNAGGDNVRVTLSISQPTGISQVKADDVNSKAYTLQGTLAQAGHKGIIIKNGKKVIR